MAKSGDTSGCLFWKNIRCVHILLETLLKTSEGVGPVSYLCHFYNVGFCKSILFILQVKSLFFLVPLFRCIFVKSSVFSMILLIWILAFYRNEKKRKEKKERKKKKRGKSKRRRWKENAFTYLFCCTFLSLNFLLAKVQCNYLPLYGTRGTQYKSSLLISCLCRCYGLNLNTPASISHGVQILT